mgnify:CR=1 FL=1
MNAGKVMAGGLVATAIVAGAAMYYLQVYHFYEDVSDRVDGIRLTPSGAEVAEPIEARDIRAIDADSSPIRFRACFATPRPLEELTTTYAAYPGAEPLNAPGWFDCFDAGEIGGVLDDDEVRAFLGRRDIEYGIDRVVAVFPDGRGFAWHQINSCGEVVFDGDPAPEGCPPPPNSE